MLIDDDRKYVFIHIGKTGGTSFTVALKPTINNGIIFDDERKHIPGRKIIKRFFSDWRNPKEYKWFCVIRNSWEMVHSHYYFGYYFAERLDYCVEKRGWTAWTRNLKKIKGMSFDEFVKLTIKKMNRSFFQHYCQDENGNDLVDNILKFENLEEEFRKMCRTIGVREDLELTKENKMWHRPHYSKDYTEDLKKRVENKNVYDIERFGFKYEQL